MNSVEGSLDELQVIAPPDAAFSFFQGESRKLVYKIRNIGAHPYNDFNIVAKTMIRVGKDDEGKALYQDTKKNYAKVLSYPGNINPQSKSKDIEVLVSVPVDYDEKIIYKGKPAIQPCRVFVTIKAVEHRQELV